MIVREAFHSIDGHYWGFLGSPDTSDGVVFYGSKETFFYWASEFESVTYAIAREYVTDVKGYVPYGGCLKELSQMVSADYVRTRLRGR